MYIKKHQAANRRLVCSHVLHDSYCREFSEQGNETYLVLYIFRAVVFILSFIDHQLQHFMYTTSNMFRLSYSDIIRELIIVDNKQFVASCYEPEHAGGCVNKVL
jgi:hypothetical protein